MPPVRTDRTQVAEPSSPKCFGSIGGYSESTLGRERSSEMNSRDDGKASPMDTLIDPGMVFEGDIQSEGGIAVEGTVKGRIMAKGEVMVTCHATVEAEIVAGTIRVEGCVTGNITAHGRLEVGATGRITGDVATKAISMKEGGIVNGIIRMLDENLKRMKQLPPPDAEYDSDSSYH